MIVSIMGVSCKGHSAIILDSDRGPLLFAGDGPYPLSRIEQNVKIEVSF